MASRHISSNSMMLSTVSRVCSSRSSSFSRYLQATWIAKLVGILVNKDTTSNDTKTSFSNCCDDMKSAKSSEFLTAEYVFPTSGLRMEERYLGS